ncbi:MAG: hypothetical protein QM708_06780 [Propioniciclava sp.]|uniref:hypothetical protein n=1 Tax=Propioniciclava sp. TaxID=2038686 RepID=UPI0039E58279
MIRPVTDPDELGSIYDEILQPSFPPAELVNRETFVHEGSSGRLDVLGAYVADACAGVIVGQRHGAAVLVVWLAVGSAGRGSGLGSTLIKAGVERWMALPGVAMVLAEVERPDLFEAHPEYGDPARRLAFYARLGAGALAVPYFQPSVGPGMPRVPGLLLATLATQNADPFPRPLDSDETDAVGEFLTSIMGEPMDGDAEMEALFGAVRDPAGVRLLPLDDYASIPLPPASTRRR